MVPRSCSSKTKGLDIFVNGNLAKEKHYRDYQNKIMVIYI